MQVIVFLGLFIWLIAPLFFTPVTWFSVQGTPFLYQYLAQAFESSQLLSKVILLFFLLLQLLLILFFFTKNNFSEKMSVMPGIWYLLYLKLGANITVISPILFTNLFILILLNFNINYYTKNIKNRVLLSGILIAISSFIDIASALLLIFIISSLVINRFNKIKDIIITFIGFVTPYIYIVSYYFLTGNLHYFIESYRHIELFSVIKTGIPLNVYMILFLAFFIFLILYLIYTCKVYFDNKLIIMRKRLISLNSMVISITVLVFFSNIVFPVNLLYLTIPLCFYFSILNQINRRIIINEVLLSLFVVMVALLPLFV